MGCLWCAGLQQGRYKEQLKHKHTCIYFLEAKLNPPSLLFGSCVNMASSISVQLKSCKILSASHFLIPMAIFCWSWDRVSHLLGASSSPTVSWGQNWYYGLSCVFLSVRWEALRWEALRCSFHLLPSPFSAKPEQIRSPLTESSERLQPSNFSLSESKVVRIVVQIKESCILMDLLPWDDLGS
jgi:hypothetical protein